ncbi:MAG: hypothetical protein ABUK01_00340 [Leptospirales bacterium]
MFILLNAVVFLLYKKESRDKSGFFYYRALEIRKRELVNLKLSAAEPYVWKPLFQCAGLNDDEGASKDCIQTKARFVPNKLENGESVKTGYEKLSPELITYTEHPAKPCLICHTKNESNLVRWQFQYTMPEMKKFYTGIWQSSDYLYANLAVVFLFLLYFGFRYLGSVTGNSDLIALYVVCNPYDPENAFSTKEGRKLRKMFLYLEAGPHFYRGYLSKKVFDRLLKVYFTGTHPFLEREIQAGAILHKDKDISFEGLRVAQAIATKAPKKGLIVQEAAMEKIHELEKNKKAVWKKGDESLNFRIFYLNQKELE